jgi:hypothetical protein
MITTTLRYSHRTAEWSCVVDGNMVAKLLSLGATFDGSLGLEY